MSKTNSKHVARTRRKAHIRKRVRGSAERPRLSVFRSAQHIYAQVVDDVSGCTLVSANTLQADVREGVEGTGNVTGASRVGTVLAERALEKGITTVVFDRNGFLYHGRVKALAESAREAGLKF